jgi:hypothetical protein
MTIKLNEFDKKLLSNIKPSDKWVKLKHLYSVNSIVKHLKIGNKKIGVKCAKHLHKLSKKDTTSITEIKDGCKDLIQKKQKLPLAKSTDKAPVETTHKINKNEKPSNPKAKPTSHRQPKAEAGTDKVAALLLLQAQQAQRQTIQRQVDLVDRKLLERSDFPAGAAGERVAKAFAGAGADYRGQHGTSEGTNWKPHEFENLNKGEQQEYRFLIQKQQDIEAQREQDDWSNPESLTGSQKQRLTGYEMIMFGEPRTFPIEVRNSAYAKAHIDADKKQGVRQPRAPLDSLSSELGTERLERLKRLPNYVDAVEYARAAADWNRKPPPPPPYPPPPLTSLSTSSSGLTSLSTSSSSSSGGPPPYRPRPAYSGTSLISDDSGTTSSTIHRDIDRPIWNNLVRQLHDPPREEEKNTLIKEMLELARKNRALEAEERERAFRAQTERGTSSAREALKRDFPEQMIRHKQRLQDLKNKLRQRGSRVNELVEEDRFIAPDPARDPIEAFDLEEAIRKTQIHAPPAPDPPAPPPPPPPPPPAPAPPQEDTSSSGSSTMSVGFGSSVPTGRAPDPQTFPFNPRASFHQRNL